MNLKPTIPKVAVLLFFIMFIYSGIMKILGFSKKTKHLKTITHLPSPINELGMIGVILLEIIGSLIILYYFWGGNIPQEIVKYTIGIFLLFLIVVTFLYHPPTDKIIPFLSNVTTFGGLLLIYNLL